MNYEGLQDSYWRIQESRVARLRNKIDSNVGLAAGRVVPDDEELAIGRGRRLRMAVRFLDISGFSGRLSETESEQEMLLRILNLFFSEMIKIAEDYGGTVERNTGDGLMAYFEDGAGDPPENGTKRAVASALTMMAANEYLIGPILFATPVTPLTFRISIDYGVVTVVRLGAARRSNASVAIGATANFASKMLAAQAGDIVIGDSAKDQLPLHWQIRFTKRVPVETGWIYRSTSRPYALYRYTGRWATLV